MISSKHNTGFRERFFSRKAVSLAFLACTLQTLHSATPAQSTLGRLPAVPAVKSLVLFCGTKGGSFANDQTFEEQGNIDGRGEKLASLFLLNYQLSSKYKLTMNSPEVALPLYKYGKNTGREVSCKTSSCSVVKKGHTRLTFSKALSLLAVLQGLVPTAEAGPCLCAACITGCCGALGMVEGPVCVLHCSVGPCAAFCLAPTP